jgi:hypothetical protein
MPVAGLVGNHCHSAAHGELDSVTFTNEQRQTVLTQRRITLILPDSKAYLCFGKAQVTSALSCDRPGSPRGYDFGDSRRS